MSNVAVVHLRSAHAGARGCRLVASILLHTPSADTRRHMYAQRPPSVRPAAWSSSSCAQLQHCSMWSMMWSRQQLVSYIVHTGPPAAAAAEQQHLVTMLRLTAPRAAPWTLHFRAGAAWSPVCACTPPDGRWSPAHHPSPSTLHPPCAVCVPSARRVATATARAARLSRPTPRQRARSTTKPPPASSMHHAHVPPLQPNVELGLELRRRPRVV